jgi:oxygen-dependent protoporphyrinogen oxidase
MTDTVIIGAGLSGLTVARKLQTRCYGHTFLVLEKDDKTGGVIRTYNEGGFIAEAGPHGFLDNCKEAKELLAETGLDAECIKAPLGRFVRYVYLHGRLQLIPQTPRTILATPLLTWREKLRVLGDIRKKPLAGQPSVSQWAEYHFGPALLPFIDAALTGTYAGDMDKLTIDGVMPGIRALEMKHGSVIRGILAKNRQNSGKRRSMPAMTSFPTGMHRLPKRLTEFLRPEVELICGCPVMKIRKTEQGWAVDSEKGTFEARNLVLALPINTSLELLQNIEGEIPLSRIPEGKITTVVLGFDKEGLVPPGFGYLIPDRENRFTLGTLFSSNMFPARAPGGCSLIEVLVGGRRHPERTELDDQELLDHAQQDIRDILKITQQPVHLKILRNSSGIPQPEQGYSELLHWRNKLTGKHKGLFVCGFGWDGIGINDMIRTAGRVADSIMAGQSTAGDAIVKGVYF